jgi:DNA-binding transcriptional ArsR family regulator
MTAPRKRYRKPYTVHEERQLRALASPMRQAIVDTVAVAGPCAMKDIAAHIGRPASALYHHVHVLREVGLLTDQPARPGRGRPGVLFDVPGRPMVIRYEPEIARTGPPMRRIVNAMTRAAARDFATSYRPGVAVSGAARRLWAARSEAWLTDAELRAVNRLLTRLIGMVQTGATRAGAPARLHSLTFVLAPRAKGPL